MAEWIVEDGETIILTVHAQPGARRAGVVGVHGDALKIRLAAPPVDGKANAALIAFLAEAFSVPARQVALLSGHAARRKRVAITGAAKRPDRQWG